MVASLLGPRLPRVLLLKEVLFAMAPVQSLSSLLKSALNKKGLSHWTRPGIEFLTEALYIEDAMGFRAFWVPRDEYEPEAELAFALAFGCKETAELWDVPRRLPEDMSDGRLMGDLRQSFKVLFGQDVHIEDIRIRDFREALLMCAETPLEGR